VLHFWACRLRSCPSTSLSLKFLPHCRWLVPGSKLDPIGTSWELGPNSNAPQSIDLSELRPLYYIQFWTPSWLKQTLRFLEFWLSPAGTSLVKGSRQEKLGPCLIRMIPPARGMECTGDCTQLGDIQPNYQEWLQTACLQVDNEMLAKEIQMHILLHGSCGPVYMLA
jgi:hypothetical protein